MGTCANGISFQNCGLPTASVSTDVPMKNTNGCYDYKFSFGDNTARFDWQTGLTSRQALERLFRGARLHPIRIQQ